MGTPEKEIGLHGRVASEKQVKVTLSSGFWLAQYECTQSQWKAVMGVNPSGFPEAGKDAPVEKISWFDCYKFLARLTPLPGRWKYELPTEAQWEYACRAGTTTAFAIGKGTYITSKDANAHPGFFNGMGSTHDWPQLPNGPYVRIIKKVGSYQANLWNLYDMHGNVNEWCRDRVTPDEAEGNPPPLPGGTDPLVLGGENAIYRGGSWHEYLEDLRSGNRYFATVNPNAEKRDIGLRIAIVSTNGPP